MKIIARFPVQLNGHIFHKGEACSYDGDITQRIADNFLGEDMKPLSVSETNGEKIAAKEDKPAEEKKADETKAKIAKTVEVLKRDGITRALEGMGITYSSKSKTEYLARLLLINKGEIEE